VSFVRKNLDFVFLLYVDRYRSRIVYCFVVYTELGTVMGRMIMRAGGGARLLKRDRLCIRISRAHAACSVHG